METVLVEEHRALKAKLMPFSGWNMPVSYSGVLAEHKAVRESCGLFDVSHMGEIRVKGDSAKSFLQFVTMNNVDRLKPGFGQYTACLNERGGFVDDLILYQLAESDYLLCVNAANIKKDYEWLLQAAKDFNVNVDDESSAFAQIAVQGPKSLAALKSVFPDALYAEITDLPYMGIRPLHGDLGKGGYIARTGYTGEKGYELYLPKDLAPQLWRQVLSAETGVTTVPVGLGARDTLRLEAGYLLYGNDMDDSITPVEAGVGWAVNLDGDDFIGKSVLVEQKASGEHRRMYAARMVDRAVPRSGMSVSLADQRIGAFTSGSHLPTLGLAGGLVLLDSKVAVGDKVNVDVRGKTKVACIEKRPLYRAKVHD